MSRCQSSELVIFKSFNGNHYVSREVLEKEIDEQLKSLSCCLDCRHCEVFFALMKVLVNSKQHEWWHLLQKYDWKKFSITPLVSFAVTYYK